MKALLWLALVGCSGAPVASPTASCPASFAAASSTRPRAAPASCTYPEGVCSYLDGCSGHRHDAPLAPDWTCRRFPVGCPSAPDEGAPCPQVGLTCDYRGASACSGSTAVCRETGWFIQPIAKRG